MKVRDAMNRIEALRGNPLILFAATHIELELLPMLFDVLRAVGRTRRLDVLFFCRGGNVNAARRIALLLHTFADHLAFIVPDRCESSGTITALAAHEIIAGPVAIFSPVDPHLQPDASPEGSGPSAISAEDIRLFGRMAGDWFGVDGIDAGGKAVATLCDSIFPTTLTAFYRSTREVQEVCEELLSLHMPDAADARARIVDRLLFGCHSHGFALTAEDLAAIGLPIRRHPEVEDAAWDLARSLRAETGSGVRSSQQEDWRDAWLITGQAAWCRRRSPGGLAPVWEEADAE